MDQVVVVGASLAGVRAAETLRAEGFTGALTVVGAEPHRPYDRPPLSKQVLTEGWDAEHHALKAGAEGALDVDWRLGVQATALDLAGQTGRGLFVLALTSNPEGPSVQHARTDSGSVAGSIVAGVTASNAAARARGELGSIGMVVGATVVAAYAWMSGRCSVSSVQPSPLADCHMKLWPSCVWLKESVSLTPSR
mgnify:CR=1 FL=1